MRSFPLQLGGGFKYLLFSPRKIGEDGTQFEYVSKWVGEKNAN